MQRRHSPILWALLPLLIAVGGCESSTAPESHIVARLLFASTSHNDTLSGDRSSCVVTAFFPLPLLPQNTLTDTTTVILSQSVNRQNGLFLAHDTLIAGTVAGFQRLSGAQLRLILGPPVSDTLAGTIGPTSSSEPVRGAWTCPSNLPFATDSALVANGYAITVSDTGQWDLQPMIPID